MAIYGIGGVSGSGKTYFRSTCSGLRESTHVDIADVYERSVAEGRPNLHWKIALKRFVSIVRDLLLRDKTRDIVLEAFFRPEGLQRKAIERLAREYGVDVR